MAIKDYQGRLSRTNLGESGASPMTVSKSREWLRTNLGQNNVFPIATAKSREHPRTNLRGKTQIPPKYFTFLMVT